MLLFQIKYQYATKRINDKLSASNSLLISDTHTFLECGFRWLW